MIINVITVIHVILCGVLVLAVLLQSGKGSDIGSVFGGGGQTLFGPTGGKNILTRVTTIAAVLFFITSLTLAKLPSIIGPEKSKLRDELAKVTPANNAMPQGLVTPEAKKDVKPVSPVSQANPVPQTNKVPVKTNAVPVTSEKHK